MAPSRALRPLRNICTQCNKSQTIRRQYTTTPPRQYASPESSSHLPRVATSSFWSSLIPKPFRRSPQPTDSVEAAKSKEWNPMTIFLILGVVVGSNAIHTIALRNEMLNFSRKTDAKLALLREVVQKVKRGEAKEGDVRRALGTGDAEVEREWEEVVSELESADVVAEGRKRRQEKREEKVEQRRGMDGEAAREREGGSGRKESAEAPANEKRPKFLM